MILEVAVLDVIEGQEDEFQTAFAEAEQLIRAAKGFIDLKLKRSIERPSRFVLLVEWEKLEDHTEGFRKSRDYSKWSALLHHFYEPFPEVEHYQ